MPLSQTWAASRSESLRQSTAGRAASPGRLSHESESESESVTVTSHRDSHESRSLPLAAVAAATGRSGGRHWPQWLAVAAAARRQHWHAAAGPGPVTRRELRNPWPTCQHPYRRIGGPGPACLQPTGGHSQVSGRPCPRVRPWGPGHTTQRARGEIFKLSLPEVRVSRRSGGFQSAAKPLSGTRDVPATQ